MKASTPQNAEIALVRLALRADPASGHRRAAKIVMAFSTEKSPVGKPSMFHCRISRHLLECLMSVGFSEDGMLTSCTCRSNYSFAFGGTPT